MSVLAAVARTRVAARPAALQITRRSLGDTVRGPSFWDFGANFAMAKQYFTKGAVSYVEYKAQCVSLRIFVFAGTLLFCTGSLFLDPPKSSYWARYSPTFLPGFLGRLFAPSSPPLFLSAKSEGTNTPDIVSQLITLRRIEGAGSGSDEE